MSPVPAPQPEGLPRVLLVGDAADTVEETAALIKDIQCKVVALPEQDRIVAAFDETEPQILLLAFMEVAEAEGCYLDLYRSSKKIQTTVHNSLLVCKAKDVEVAYRLCMRKLFDDYVVIRPLHDPFRLTVAIRNLLASQKTSDQSADLQKFMAGIRSQADAMDAMIRESMREGASIQAQLGQSGEQLKQRLNDKLHAFAEQMASPSFDGVVSVNDRAAFGERIAHFAQQNLSGEVNAALETSQAALGQLLKRSESDYTAQAKANAGLDAWLETVKPTILVVDDDTFYLSVIKRMLSGEGYEVVTTPDPVEGLNLAARIRPTAILVDFEMPGMSGLDYIARARTAPRLRDTPIIMLTGHSERDVVHGARTAGVTGYLLKPCNKDTLLKKLRLHIGPGSLAK